MKTVPVVGITIGDPGGIGPEIVLKALAAHRYAPAKLVLFGSEKVLLHNSKVLRIPLHSDVQIVDVDNVKSSYFGAAPEIAGPASIEYLDKAFEYYGAGKINALVTGPIQKESWHRAGHAYPGQTEYCATKTGADDYAMLMAGKHFRIAVLSTHVSLREALTHVKRDKIEAMIRLLNREFRLLGYDRPRIGCAALNPHASENGAFGNDEIEHIIPALEQMRKEGADVEGPFAPEVIFRVAVSEQKWDVILAMYHDQAMIPLKLLDFHDSANVTLGLPLIRTSPDHGTAFDIAGKGIASPTSTITAIKVAIEWTQLRQKHANHGA